ncbi:MAG: hypothetical protein NTY66_03710, partial [Candidatus Vogelbacteria bacterium]|nr:hypothetical protein [Candidatus Vogelbacteria bacterium]
MAVFWVKNKVASPIVPPLATSTPTGGIEFSFDKIKVGQKIGDFTVLSVGPKNGGMPYDEFNVQVDFDGDVKLSGTYDVRYYEMPGSYI